MTATVRGSTCPARRIADANSRMLWNRSAGSFAIASSTT
jgi:hypothetical protein